MAFGEVSNTRKCSYSLLSNILPSSNSFNKLVNCNNNFQELTKTPNYAVSGVWDNNVLDCETYSTMF